MANNSNSKKPNRPRFSLRDQNGNLDKLTVGLLAAFLVVGIITAVLAFNIVRGVVMDWSGDGPGGLVIDPRDPSKQATPSGTQAVVELQPVGNPTPQPWDGKSRVTVLVMGLDYEDTEARRNPRTDTMMLLTLDPISNTAGILSIPRDAWVNIPGSDYGKINTAYFIGDSFKLPGGGPGKAIETVEAFLGIPINYYAQIDFVAFEDFIDLLGGLDLHVKEEITVDPIGPNNTVTLYPGVQPLDGKTVLAFARDRYTGQGDYDRAARQQQVVLAVREQILTLNMLPTLIAKSPQMYAQLQSGIHTNLNLQQIVQLSLLAVKVPEENIKNQVFGPNCFVNAMHEGQSIEIPVPDCIRVVRDEVFSTADAVAPAALVSEGEANKMLELAKQEKARVTVQNGSQEAGLAERTAEYLRGQGLNIIEVSNADQVYYNSAIMIMNGRPYTAKYLAETLRVPNGSIFNRFDPKSNPEIILIVGQDWAANNPMP